MSFTLSASERISRARSDLRLGLPVLIASGDRAVLAMAAELVTADGLAKLAPMGQRIMALTRWRAQTLKIPAYDDDMVRIRLGTTTDAALIQALADPARDLDYPMKGPFAAIRDEAPDLARAAIRLVKSAHLLPSAVLVQVEAGFDAGDLTRIPLSDLSGLDGLALSDVAHARVPLAVSPEAAVHVFRPDDGTEEHYAIRIGTPENMDAVPVRLHSACFTGDVIGSRKCDCGDQLSSAMTQMAEMGGGFILYLNQEGRGIGLANKMRAYALQDQGFDTVEANHRLGFEDDERDFRIGSTILKSLKVTRIRLMTNNPAKLERMAETGIEVLERIPLKVGLRPENEGYLATKAAKSGHLL